MTYYNFSFHVPELVSISVASRTNQLPCFCGRENRPEYVHSSTLAIIETRKVDALRWYLILTDWPSAITEQALLDWANKYAACVPTETELETA